jgi:leucyl-tRNA synthetase
MKEIDYDPQKVEKKWQLAWAKHKVFAAPAHPKSGKKSYILDMFPYPSAQGLHVGHPEGYTASDIVARYLRMKGKGVLHPMGFDSFGLPAENYAIKTGTHPAKTTAKNIENMRRQIQSLGFSYDWDREVITSDPKYYKWTQWIFLKLFEQGLAYEAEAPINWCPKDKTGLANEEVVGGKCERCGTPVEKKNIRQWLVKITDERYIERLLNDLDNLDWSDSIKQLQRNWIGKSEGALVSFELSAASQEHRKNKPSAQSPQPKAIQIFTTRPDTLFGATYLVLSPEHKLVKEITTAEHKQEVEKYITKASQKSDLDRTDLAKDKTGVFTGAYAINPVNNEMIPVWVADYVLATYGTGAIMAVPAHDARDNVFAKKYKLPIIKVIEPSRLMAHSSFEARNVSTSAYGHLDADLTAACWTDEGIMLPLTPSVSPPSEGGEGKRGYDKQFAGTRSEDFRKAIVEWLEKIGKGKTKVQYKLRDWVFSRQRYWGEPIPIIHCEICGDVSVPEKDLPVELPKVEKYEPTGTGESPLASISKWVNTKCPKCGGLAKRETNTMPQWAGSNWYFLRYCDPHNAKKFADPKKLAAWLPVDAYVGGAEHAVLHLLYARFIYKVLYDIGAVPKSCGEEPFRKLKNQGLILGEDGQKMSKSRGNVINPDVVIHEYGADAVRMYEMFMGPFDDAKPWSTQGIRGITRFLERIWKVTIAMKNLKKVKSSNLIHGTVKRVTENIESFKFNTAVSALMVFFNEREDWGSKLNSEGNLESETVDVDALEKFLKLLSPFAPHIAEELWCKLGHKTLICEEPWPSFDPNKATQDIFILPVQINGKVREKIEVSMKSTENEIRILVLANAKVHKWLNGKEPKQFRYVPGKIVSIVV